MAEVFSYLPEPARTIVRTAWSQVPPDMRGDLQMWLPYALNDVGGARDLFGFITENYRSAFDNNRSKIAIVGPANVGKSTLYNQFIARDAERAAVGPTPGTTRENQESEGGLFTLIDTPGAEAVGEIGEREQEIAFEAARAADFLIIVFDAAAGILRPDLELFNALKALGKPFVVVMNKMDLVAKRDRDKVLDAAAATLGMDRAELIDISASTGDNVGRVVLAVAQTDPRLLTLIGDALPEYRSKLAWQRIVTASSAAATVALIPIPMADVIPLIAIQTGLVLNIARIYGYEMSLERAKELIAAFGMGFLARTVQRQLAKALGVPGWILSSAIAAAATVAIGYASVLWFERGERPSKEQLEKLVRDVSVYLRDELMGLRLKRPDGTTIRMQVRRALEGLPTLLRPARKPHKKSDDVLLLSEDAASLTEDPIAD